ncbi:MAG: hypothetical protein GF411_09205 [Candidatus Lokiarchaeota archaeon]|nr:hypothetical protein [Candidatus Lokiarchaeota archaeon]
MKSETHIKLRHKFEMMLNEHDVRFEPNTGPKVWELGHPSLNTLVNNLRKSANPIFLVARFPVLILFSSILAFSLLFSQSTYITNDGLLPLYSFLTQLNLESLFTLLFRYPTASFLCITLTIMLIYLDSVLYWSDIENLTANMKKWFGLTFVIQLIVSFSVGLITDLLFAQTAESSDKLLGWFSISFFLAIILALGFVAFLRRYVYLYSPSTFILEQKVKAVRSFLYSVNPVMNQSSSSTTSIADAAFSSVKRDVYLRCLALFLFGFLPAIGIPYVFSLPEELSFLVTSLPMLLIWIGLLVILVRFQVKSIESHYSDISLNAMLLLMVTLLGCLILGFLPVTLLSTGCLIASSFLLMSLFFKRIETAAKSRVESMGSYYYREYIRQSSSENIEIFINSVYDTLGELLRT